MKILSLFREAGLFYYIFSVCLFFLSILLDTFLELHTWKALIMFMNRKIFGDLTHQLLINL